MLQRMWVAGREQGTALWYPASPPTGWPLSENEEITRPWAWFEEVGHGWVLSGLCPRRHPAACRGLALLPATHPAAHLAGWLAQQGRLGGWGRQLQSRRLRACGCPRGIRLSAPLPCTQHDTAGEACGRQAQVGSRCLAAAGSSSSSLGQHHSSPPLQQRQSTCAAQRSRF